MRIRATVVAVVGAGGLLAGALAATTPALAAGPVAFTDQFGTSDDDSGAGDGVYVGTAANGDVYVTGVSTGDLGSGFSSGMFLARYDKTGTRKWLKQYGLGVRVSGITVSSTGDAYIGGITGSDLDGSGPAPFGDEDGFVAKFDKNGKQKWVRQIGSFSNDRVARLALSPSGDLYIGGETAGTLNGTNAGGYDAWVAKYDKNGKQKWIRQFGSGVYDITQGLAATKNDVYVGGHTEGDLDGAGTETTDLDGGGSNDAFLVRFDKNGTRVWSRQWGSTGNDATAGVAVDKAGTAIYVAGHSSGDIDAGGPVVFGGDGDVMVVRFAADGSITWKQGFGGVGYEEALGVAVSPSGVPFIGGWTNDDIDDGGPNENLGSDDFVTARFDAATGAITWKRQFGTSARDVAHGLAATATQLVLGGYTDGTIFGHTHIGDYDAVVASLPQS